ncbi:Cell morphogenesis protein PAG1 [Tieghemiomyces parasiticus]|uniref:Cell morphogenesis protein PAG1 n=1 Tax=Tieghemiomyces parasiticus TaxID=78921 RepID=A0A9W7ZZU2_9FUNG|nr:Cell morphogenesis protein PAG1 [Tieghemiomyces parasiticus]
MPFSTFTVPADSKQYIIRSLQRNFSYYADIQVKLFVDSPRKARADLVAVLGLEPTGSLGQVMRTMAMIAKSSASEVIESLLQWRKETMQQDTPLPAPGDVNGLPEGLSVRAALPLFSPDFSHHDSLWRPTVDTPGPGRLSGSAVTLGGPGGLAAGLVTPAAVTGAEPAALFTPPPPAPSQFPSARTYVPESREERKELAYVYLLCQALITIFERIQAEDLSNDLGTKMEALAFVQLKSPDVADTLARCRNRQIIADMYMRLIGAISGVRFATMSDRFIAELEKVPSTGPIPHEGQVEMVIRGMRYLQLKVYPVESLEETAQFLLSCTKFFVQTAHGPRLKCAYTEVFTQLLLPIGAVADAEVNFPDWAKSMDLLLSRATKMTTKPRYLSVAYPFFTAVLCASPREVFLARLPGFLDLIFLRTRDRHVRHVALGCLCRVVWAYLFRYRAPGKEVHRQLEALIKQMFGTRKRPTNITDLPLDYYVYVVFCLLHYNLAWTVTNVMSFLLQLGDSETPSTIGPEQLHAERAIVGLRALLLYLESDAQSEDRPPFPAVHDLLASHAVRFTLPVYPRLREEFSVPVLPWADDLYQLVEKSQLSLARYLLTLDATYGADLVTKKRYVTFPPPGQTSGIHHQEDDAPDVEDPTGPATATDRFLGGFDPGSPGGSGAGNTETRSLTGSTTNLFHAGHAFSSLSTPFHSFTHSLGHHSASSSTSTTALAGMITSAKELATETQQYQQVFTTFNTVYPREKQPAYDLLATVIEVTPDLMPAQILPQRLSEMLSTYLLHIDPRVSRAAAGAALRLTTRIGAYSVLVHLSQTLVQVDDRVDEILTRFIYVPGPTVRPAAGGSAANRRELLSTTTLQNADQYPGWATSPPAGHATEPSQRSHGNRGGITAGRTVASHNPSPAHAQAAATTRGFSGPIAGAQPLAARPAGGLLHLYHAVLRLFLAEVEQLDRQGLLDTAADRWQTDHRAIANLIDELEGLGLFYLVHQAPRVRGLASAILHTVATLGDLLTPHLSDDHPIPMTPTEKVRSKQHNQMLHSRRFLYTELHTTMVPLGDPADGPCPELLFPNLERLRDIYVDGGTGTSTATHTATAASVHHQSGSAALLAANHTRTRSESSVGSELPPVTAVVPPNPDEYPAPVDLGLGPNRDLLDFIASKPDPYVLLQPGVGAVAQGSAVPEATAVAEGALGSLTARVRHIALFDLARSPHPTHRALWEEYFSSVVQRAYAIAPATVVLARDVVCRHFHQMYSLVVHYSEIPSKIPVLGFAAHRTAVRAGAFDAELVDQWRFYLEFISTTLTPDLEREVGAGAGRVDSVFSRPLAKNMRQVLTTADLVQLTTPFFTAENPIVRSAVVRGLGRIHGSSYMALFTALHPTVSSLLEVALLKSAHKAYSTLKRDRKMDRTRECLVHLFRLTARYLRTSSLLADTDHLNTLVTFVREIRNFLTDTGTQTAWDYQNLRIQFCGLVDVLYYHLSHRRDPGDPFPFKMRVSLFRLFETWGGFGQHSEATREREAAMIGHVLDKYHDVLERGVMASLMEDERTALEGAALRAMATLCRGPVVRPAAVKAGQSFNLEQLFGWVEAVFDSPDRRVHRIAKHSVEWLLAFNKDHPLVLREVVRLCYHGDPARPCTRGYFMALKKTLAGDPEYPYASHVVLPLALLKLGDLSPGIRHAAFRLLQAIERRFFLDRCYEYFESAAFSPLATLYRHAQVGLSATMSEHHPVLTNDIISEVFGHLDGVSEQGQREMLRFLRPWFCNVDLILDRDAGRIMEPGHCHLLSLFHLTLTLSKRHLLEIEQLWSALVFKDNSSNCDLIVGFLINLALSKRNPTLLEYIKKVMVFLARTTINTHLLHTIVGYITPDLMVPSLRADYSDTLVNSVENIQGDRSPSAETAVAAATPCRAQALFDADYPTYEDGPVFSPGQIALVLLVELPSEVGSLLKPYVPLLLHAMTVHIDYGYARVSPLVCVMLANFIRFTVLDHHQPLETVDTLLGQLATAEANKREHGLPLGELTRFVRQLVEVFSCEEMLPVCSLRHAWGTVALQWGTQCPVRNVACASFRIFSAIMPRVTLGMCVEMINRLSNTIADDQANIQEFSVSILSIFRKVLRSIRPEGALRENGGLVDQESETDVEVETDPLASLVDQHSLDGEDPAPLDLNTTHEALAPVLFWTASVCLFSHLEVEYEQGLAMLELILQLPGWRFPSIHRTDHLLCDLPLHLQAQMGLPIATLAAPPPLSAHSPGIPAQPALRPMIMRQYPKKWGGKFPGIFWLLIRGYRFARQRVRCQKLLTQLISLASDPLVGITEEAVALLLLAHFPLLCLHVERRQMDGEAALLMDLVSAVVPDVVHDVDAREALRELFGRYKAQGFYNVGHFIKEVVRLVGHHFTSFITDAMFLLLFQLPEAPASHQEIILQTLDTFVAQYRSNAAGLFDRDDTLPTVNILLNLMATPFEAQVSRILDCLVLRAYRPTGAGADKYSGGGGVLLTSPPLAGQTVPLGNVKTFTWYGFNSAVSRPKTRHQLCNLVKTVAAQQLMVARNIRRASTPQVTGQPTSAVGQGEGNHTVLPSHRGHSSLHTQQLDSDSSSAYDPDYPEDHGPRPYLLDDPLGNSSSPDLRPPLSHSLANLNYYHTRNPSDALESRTPTPTTSVITSSDQTNVLGREAHEREPHPNDQDSGPGHYRHISSPGSDGRRAPPFNAASEDTCHSVPLPPLPAGELAALKRELDELDELAPYLQDLDDFFSKAD